jgi:hypothetical protein
MQAAIVDDQKSSLSSSTLASFRALEPRQPVETVDALVDQTLVQLLVMFAHDDLASDPRIGQNV